jgi:hypothetical protein
MGEITVSPSEKSNPEGGWPAREPGCGPRDAYWRALREIERVSSEPGQLFASLERPSMLLELGRFVALLLSILCLYALFHTVFFLPIGEGERFVATLKMFALTASICWASGWIFREYEHQAGVRHSTIAGTLPMKAFWWSSFAISILFVVSWYFEKYFLPSRAQPLW